LGLVVASSLVGGLVLLGSGLAQAEKGKKYALLVGVKDYRSAKFEPLRFTENDAEDLAEVLRRQAGFSVRVLTTSRGEKSKGDAPTRDNLVAAIKVLLAGKERNDTLLIALAGHGLQATVKDKDDSFFCPSDAQFSNLETLLSLTQLVKDLDGCDAGVKLLLVDACRNDPGAGRNLNQDTLRPPRGLAALFSCKSGERAFEHPKLGKGHGVFFHHVIEGLKGEAKNKRGEITWSSLADHVIDSVSEDVPRLIGGGAKQTPEQKLNITGKSPLLIAPGKEKVVKEGAKTITNSIGMKLARIPAGKFTMGSTKEEQDEAGADYEKTYGVKLSDSVMAVYRSEGPQHQVEITRAFYLGDHEVTQAQFKEVMGYNPSAFSADGTGKPGVSYGRKPAERKKKVQGMSTDDFPVENVSWDEAVEFCKKLSALPAEKRAGRKYRLPTEAEWEYACRGSASAYRPFHFGNSLSSKQANFDGENPYGGASEGNRLGRTCKVGSYEKNGFGLYDMHGNVCEWCSDWYAEDYYSKSPRRDPQGPAAGTARVVRGGDWGSTGAGCRSASRPWFWPDSRGYILGFRAALVPSE
jgi:formylglycine-generating enzyme required for sulfatase activity